MRWQIGCCKMHFSNLVSLGKVESIFSSINLVRIRRDLLGSPLHLSILSAAGRPARQPSVVRCTTTLLVSRSHVDLSSAMINYRRRWPGIAVRPSGRPSRSVYRRWHDRLAPDRRRLRATVLSQLQQQKQPAVDVVKRRAPGNDQRRELLDEWKW